MSQTIPTYPGLTYQGDACADLCVSEKTLRRLMAKRDPPVTAVKKPGERQPDGRVLPRTYVPTWFVREEETARFPKLLDGQATVEDAAKILQCSIPKVHLLIEEKVLVLPG